MIHFRLFINALIVAALFGVWQQSYHGALFIFVLLGFILSCIDYFKAKP